MICKHPGCDATGFECCVLTGTDDDPPVEYYCTDHAMQHGFCTVCGVFSAGMETFEFIHPGVCDTCDDELRAENDELDEIADVDLDRDIDQ